MTPGARLTTSRPLAAGSAFTSSVESGGFFGGILAGYVADAAVKRRQKQLQVDPSPRPWNPRMPVALLFMIAVAVNLHLLYFAVDASSSRLWITTVGFLLGASLYGPIAIFGVVATEAAPVALSGTAHAIVALAANSQYFLSLETSFLFDSRLVYSRSHRIGTSVCICCQVLFLVNRIFPPGSTLYPHNRPNDRV